MSRVRYANSRMSSFRKPMAVTQVVAYRTGDTYPLCPRCGIAMEREYQNYCDRCGQRLGWNAFHRAVILTRF